MKLVKHGKASSGSPAPARTPRWSPLQRLQADLDRLLEEPFGGWFPGTELLESWGPSVDVYEDRENVYVKIELPGMKKEDIEVSLVGGELNIAGERREQSEYKGAETYRRECYTGRFQRSIALPAEVEPGRIEAHYKDGVLTVTCPKTQEARRKQVEIKID